MSNEKKILIIQTAFPGDSILTLPFIQELKKQKPDFALEVLSIPLTAQIFEASPYVDKVIKLDKKGKHKSIFSFIKFVRELKQRKYSIVYSPHRSLRSAITTLMLSAEESYGFENSNLKFAFKKCVKYDPSAHEVRRNLEFLNRDFNDENWRILPEVSVSNESEKKVSEFLIEKNLKSFITIAPGSVWATKKYLAEYFRKVIEHFVNQNFQMVLIGGSEDKPICNELLQGFENSVHLAAGEFSFIESIELLKQSSLLICNDSAPTHLGMCADIPVLTIYCSTVPEFGFYPYNDRSSYLSFDDLNCKPCGIHGYQRCPIESFLCAKLLDPEKVIEKAKNMISNAR